MCIIVVIVKNVAQHFDTRSSLQYTARDVGRINKQDKVMAAVNSERVIFFVPIIKSIMRNRSGQIRVQVQRFITEIGCALMWAPLTLIWLLIYAIAFLLGFRKSVNHRHLVGNLSTKDYYKYRYERDY